MDGGGVTLPDAERGKRCPGEVYLRRDKAWKLIGYIHEGDKDTGFITPVGED